MITCDLFLFLILCILSPGRHNFVESGRTTLSHTRNSGKNDGQFEDSKFTHRRPNDSNNRLKKNFDPDPKFYYSDYSEVEQVTKFDHNLISLDINRTKSTKEFEYNYNPITRADIFEVKPPNLLRKVTDRERLLWESKRGKYSDKIVAFKDDNGENRIQVYIAEDSNSTRKPKLAPPLRVPGVRSDAQDKKDESKDKEDEPKKKADISEDEKHSYRERREEPRDSRRDRHYPRDEIIEIPKKSRDRRSELKRHQEEMLSRRRMEENKIRDRYKYKRQRDEFRRMEDYRLPKLRPRDRHEPQGRRSTLKGDRHTPGELFLLFATKTPNTKKFDLLVNGDTERYQFKSDTQCVRVKVDKQILWKHRKNQDFPSSLEYDKRDGMILLEFSGFTEVYINAGGIWYYRV